MTQNKRTFASSFSVRIGTSRRRFELAEAGPYGGDEGTYRVRRDRRWLDGFYDRSGLADLIAAEALGGTPEPPPKPDIPYPSRVTVYDADSDLSFYGSWTNSEPIRDHSGQWVVNVTDTRGKRIFVPCKDVKVI